MSSTCPACGVAVVPGYVKCPRCGARLPSIKFRRPGETADAGGTAVEGGRAIPWTAIVSTVVVAGAIIAFFGIRHARGAPRVEEPPPPPSGAPTAARVATPAPAAPAVFVPSAPAPAPSGPSSAQVAVDLQRTLDQQQLWSIVTVDRGRLEIRSSLCGDAQMKPAIEAAAERSRAAGLTALRCVEQSGTVAFSRDL